MEPTEFKPRRKNPAPSISWAELVCTARLQSHLQKFERSNYLDPTVKAAASNLVKRDDAKELIKSRLQQLGNDRLVTVEELVGDIDELKMVAQAFS